MGKIRRLLLLCLIVTGDASCLTQMNGGLNRPDSDQRVVHIADFLARAASNGNAGRRRVTD